MKKVITGLIAIIVALTLGGCSVRFGVNSRDEIKEGKEINKTSSISGVNRLVIESSVSEFTIEAYDGEEVKVQGTLSGYSKGIDVNTNGGDLNIKEKSTALGINILGSGFNNTSNVEVLIPKSFKGDIKFTQGVGTTDIKDIKVGRLDIKGGAGEIRSNNISFDKLDVDSGVGVIDIYVGEKSGDINIKGGVGEVSVDLVEVGGNLTFSGGVGQGKIRIPRNAPVRFNTKSGLGSCDVTAVTSGEGTYTFDLKVGVGEIKVYN